MEIAIFGASGLLGAYAAKAFEQSGHKVHAVSRSSKAFPHDASDFASASGFFESHRPDFVLNAVKSSMSTDECEARQEEAWKANVTAAENLARLCAQHGCRLVHMSSDWVYGGKEGEIYTEESALEPLNFYAKTKAAAEEKVLSHKPDALVLRTTGIFGVDPKGKNVFSRFWESACAGKEFACPDDQFSQPIFAGELARIIAALCEQEAEGVFNAVGPDYISRYDLALRFCDAFSFPRSLAKPVKSSSRSIRVPMHLRLDTSKMERLAKVAALDAQIAKLREEVVK